MEQSTRNIKRITHIMKKRACNKGLAQPHFCAKHKSEAGVTLVEVIVALSLFTTVVAISSGAVVSLLQANRQARAGQLVANNIAFVLEDITKNLRVGTNYHCGSGQYEEAKDCTYGTNPTPSELAFEPEFGDPDDPTDQIVFRLKDGAFEKSVDGGSQFTRVTAPEINIDAFHVYVYGAISTDDEQPRVTLSLRGAIELANNEIQDFSVQTTVTQRILDIALSPPVS